MRFALLGNHEDGLEFSCALIESGSHELVSYSADVPAAYRKRFGERARLVPDLEEILADPGVELVVVAGSVANRPAQLRGALQSERHVACVYPPDESPDIAHEASMLQGDTGKVLFPILPRMMHPAVELFTERFRGATGGVLRVEMALADRPEHVLQLPGWEVLRRMGGEIAELAGFAPSEEAVAGEPVLVSGRFSSGMLFHISAQPGEERCRIAVEGEKGSVELSFPGGWAGPTYLSERDQGGAVREQVWTAWDPWPVLAGAFDDALAKRADFVGPTWLDVVRGLELDDALRRSIKQRRAVVLDYQEGSEEVGFKGTMTLVGCGLLWALVASLILASWFPALAWGIVPLLVVFLGLQAFRWIIPGRAQQDEPRSPEARG